MNSCESGEEKDFSTPNKKFKHIFNREFNRLFPFGFKYDFKILFLSAIPLILNQISQTFLPIISLFFCGHIGSSELAAVTIANTFINIGSFSVLVGLCSACDTLLPQIFGGFNKKKVGLVLQKGLIISFLSCFPTSGVLLNVKNVMQFFIKETEVIELADQYIITYLPAIIFYSFHVVLQRYVLSQNIFYPILAINILANILDALLHYLFVIHFNYGVVGAAFSVVLANFFILVSVVIYIIYTKMYNLTWSGWSKECLADWTEYLKLAIPGFAMLFFGLANFEIGVIAAGNLGREGISIMSIGIQTTYIAFMIPLGISISANIRIGQLLGENSPELAKNCCKVAYAFGGCASFLTCLVIYSSSNIIPTAFTNEKKIIDEAAVLLKFLSFAHLMDALQGVGGGVLKAMGAQMYGFMMVLVSLYCFGIPLGIMLMLRTQYKVLGYWIGYLVGATILIGLQIAFIGLVNWSKKAEIAFNQSLKSSETESIIKDANSNYDQNITIVTPLLNRQTKNFTLILMKKALSIIIIISTFFALVFTRLVFVIDDEKEKIDLKY
ncbi:multidrug and toxin extrusion 1 [Brachionus plicatilis]|uniref:Multidrug and toxin extrusion protein n=1 Tax=Brachionus plicatilis TaxID=10195 RepID=A0A3M7R2R1_BRAPC|nr:multidrug and toxin extrusion 1 [Brachionus plicatilis]